MGYGQTDQLQAWRQEATDSRKKLASQIKAWEAIKKLMSQGLVNKAMDETERQIKSIKLYLKKKESE